MAPFFGVEAGERCGFLKTKAWEDLKKSAEAKWDDNIAFFAPKPGVLYPAVYDLAERVLAAAKAVRPFGQTEQTGWRDSLTGESEWLTTDETQLSLPPGQRKDTLWTLLAEKKPAWAKKGEHLGALSAIKRLWPTLFAEEVADALEQDRRAADRFVVSTHTNALARNLERLNEVLANEACQKRLEPFVEQEDRTPALPRSLARLRGSLAARIPAVLDRLNESDTEQDAAKARKVGNEINQLLGHKPEAYYALLLFDGDHMGRILSGDLKYAISYLDSFHKQVRTGFKKRAIDNADIKAYGEQKRALSPNRHLAISAALNDFALHVVSEIVEREHLGRVIYAGGDDVMAMLPVADLLPAMQRLRYAYSGAAPEDQQTDWGKAKHSKKLICKDGFALLRGRLFRMMGETATASCGAVIAHHQAPLPAVRRELDAAEKRAKNEGGRNAFSITLIKRSGGATQFTAKWGEPLELLLKFRDFLADKHVSRRAAYNCLVWLKDLPDDADEEMLGSLLGYQFNRQGGEKERSYDLAKRLAVMAVEERKRNNAQNQDRGKNPESKRENWLRDFLGIAEFLARETRSLGEPEKTVREDAA